MRRRRLPTRVRELAGILLKDVWRYERALWSSGPDWRRICNRREELVIAPDGIGVGCTWRWTSALHAPRFVPSWGRRLMARALREYPIVLQRGPPDVQGDPRVSFIIGHRGTARLPLLLLVLQSIAGQRDLPTECVVVEEAWSSEIAGLLPSWVRYVFSQSPSPTAGYNRSRAFNVGVRAARGGVFVLHDGDLAVPSSYARDVATRFEEGCEAANLKRFIFYLSREQTERVLHTDEILPVPPETVLQNLVGGGSVAIGREAFLRIGGMDEGFVGWGGEDVEFWERAETLRVWDYQYLPMVHLWHAPQPEKDDAKASSAMQRWRELAATDPKRRIDALRDADAAR